MKLRLKHILFFFTLLLTLPLSSQSIYKTPSGKKYHLSTCRMVETVSQKVSPEEIEYYNLEPCKICKPPQSHALGLAAAGVNKSVGEKSYSTRCLGTTQKNTRCKHSTKSANGYCYQHVEQYQGRARPSSSQRKRSKSSYTPTPYTSSKCGARTRSGNSCKRKVKGGGRCYQHRART